MTILTSSSNGSLKVVQFTNKPPITQYGKEICPGDSNITKIKRVSIKGAQHLILLRQNSTIQLYKLNSDGDDYQKVKEWKNCLLHNLKDKIVKMGVLMNQYLYSCSYDGKLVITDLVNDDYDGSFKCYSLQGSVTAVKVCCNKILKQLVVLVGNKEGGLKSYEIYMEKEYYTDETEETHSLFNIRTGMNIREHPTPISRYGDYNNIQNMNQIRSLLRNRNSISKERLKPNFETTREVATNSNTLWILSIEMTNKFIITGTAQGYIVLYDKTTKQSTKSFNVSRFAVIKLLVIGNKLIFTDLLANIGILNLDTFSINRWSYTFGIIEQNCILYKKNSPVFRVVALNVNGVLTTVEINPIVNRLSLVRRTQLDDLCKCFQVIG